MRNWIDGLSLLPIAMSVNTKWPIGEVSNNHHVGEPAFNSS